MKPPAYPTSSPLGKKTGARSAKGVIDGGLPYDAQQSWSKASRDQPSRPDGIAYRARHDDDAICVALYDHTFDSLEEVSRQLDLLKQDWFLELMDACSVGVAPP
jgi:hypothetical protein